MGRRVSPRVRSRPEEALRGDVRDWGDFAAQLREYTLSDRRIAEELTARHGYAISEAEVAAHLAEIFGAPERPVDEPSGFAYFYGQSETLTPARRRRIEREAQRRLSEGESQSDVAAWKRRELARHQPLEHRCYDEDDLFTSEQAVACFGRFLRDWHAVSPRPLTGEDVEYVVADVWRELGHEILLAPRNNRGADIHVRRNDWVAISLKSEARQNPSKSAIEISAVAQHHMGEPKRAGDVKSALFEIVNHLHCYDRMIHLRSTKETFPGTDTPAHRYTFYEVPIEDMIQRLRSIHTIAFRHYFDNPGAAFARNSFHHDVCDEQGRRLFSVTVFKRPPHVKIGAIAIEYCRPLASYWLSPIDERPRGNPEGWKPRDPFA